MSLNIEPNLPGRYSRRGENIFSSRKRGEYDRERREKNHHHLVQAQLSHFVGEDIVQVKLPLFTLLFIVKRDLLI